MDQQKYLWYALKKNISNEDSIAKIIREHVITYQMEKEIADVQVIKDYKIIEEEFPPNSDLLPKKLFRNSKKIQWIRLGNGYYKKIRIVEEKLFKGLIFVKLAVNATKANNWLFQQITQWVPGTMFLGRKNAPESITEETFEAMSGAFIGKEMPDLQQYLIDRKLITDQPLPLNESTEKQGEVTGSAEEDWSDFDVILKDQFEQLFQSEKIEEAIQHKRFNEIGIINVSNDEPSVNQPVNKPTQSELPNSTLVEPIEPTLAEVIPPVEPIKPTSAEVIPPVEPIKPTSEDVIPPVNLEPIKFQVGDRAWAKKLQIEVEVKEVIPNKRKLVIEFEVFNRVQNLTVDVEEIEEIS